MFKVNYSILSYYPEYNIAVSWQRLREGKTIKKQDLYCCVMRRLNII